MSNDYFNNTDPLARHTVARAEAVNTKLSDVATGFDLLPRANDLARGATTFQVATGTANSYVAEMPKTWTDYQDGAECTIRFPVTNTGSSTLSIDGLGARSIKTTEGNNAIAGDIVAGSVHTLLYDADAATWRMLTFTPSYLQSISDAGAASLVALEALEARVELMEAAVIEATGLDLTEFNIGDLLQVKTDGAGGKQLVMSGQRLENSASFTGATPSLDLSTAQYHRGTLTANTTFSFDTSDIDPTTTNALFFLLRVTQHAVSTFTLTFPASVEWPGGLPPDAPDPGATTVFAFASGDGAVTWEGSFVGGDYS